MPEDKDNEGGGGGGRSRRRDRHRKKFKPPVRRKRVHTQEQQKKKAIERIVSEVRSALVSARTPMEFQVLKARMVATRALAESIPFYPMTEIETTITTLNEREAIVVEQTQGLDLYGRPIAQGHMRGEEEVEEKHRAIIDRAEGAREEYREAVEDYHNSINFAAIDRDLARLEANPPVPLTEKEIAKHRVTDKEEERAQRLQESINELDRSYQEIYERASEEYRLIERLEERRENLARQRAALEQDDKALEVAFRGADSGTIDRLFKARTELAQARERTELESRRIDQQITDADRRFEELAAAEEAHRLEEERQKPKIKEIREAAEKRKKIFGLQARIYEKHLEDTQKKKQEFVEERASIAVRDDDSSLARKTEIDRKLALLQEEEGTQREEITKLRQDQQRLAGTRIVEPPSRERERAEMERRRKERKARNKAERKAERRKQRESRRVPLPETPARGASTADPELASVLNQLRRTGVRVENVGLTSPPPTPKPPQPPKRER